MARLTKLTPPSSQDRRQSNRNKLQANRYRRDDEEEKENKRRTLDTRKTRTIRRIEEDLGFDLTRVFSPWPSSLEVHELGLNTLATLEELLRIFSRYQRLDDRQIRQKIAQAIPSGKKPTFGPLNKLLRRLQAVPDSSQHLSSPPTSRGRRRASSDTESDSDAESTGEEDFTEDDKESSVELGRGLSEGLPDGFNHSSDNLDIDEDHLPAEDSTEPSQNRLEDDTSFLHDSYDPPPDEQIDPPRDEDHLLFKDPLEPGPEQVEDETPNDWHHPLSEEEINQPRDDCSRPLLDGQNGSPSPIQSELPPRRAESTQSRMANLTARRKGTATDPKDTAAEKPRTSGPAGEDKTRAGLQLALADAKSKHYDAEKEVQRWQESCIKISEVADQAERKMAASRGTRLEPQDLRNSDPEVLRHKAKSAGKRAKHHQLLMQVAHCQERRLEAMSKARERSTRTQEVIQRIEALLEHISDAELPGQVDQSSDNDGEIDALMVELDDDSCCEDS